MKTLTVILVFLSASAAGDIIPTYEITRETLPGTWEAVADVYSVPFLYRMEIRGDTNSYLVSVAKSGDAPTRLTVLRMVGSEIVAGEVTLRFRGMEVDETLQVVFQGSGTMLNEAEGALRGKFSCTTEAFSPCLVRGEVNFKRVLGRVISCPFQRRQKRTSKNYEVRRSPNQTMQVTAVSFAITSEMIRTSPLRATRS